MKIDEKALIHGTLVKIKFKGVDEIHEKKQKDYTEGRIINHEGTVYVAHNNPDFSDDRILNLLKRDYNRFGFKYFWVCGADEGEFKLRWVKELYVHPNQKYLEDGR